MKYLTSKRHEVVRSMLHTHNLDVGSGNVPITPESIQADLHHNGINICNMPFRNNQFDSITALEILEHLDMDALLWGMSEITRVLCSGGQLIVSVPNYSWWMRDFQNISWFIRRHITLRDYKGEGHTNMQPIGHYISLLTHYGFSVREVRRVYLYDYIIRAIKN